jgi:hypothetical protein
MSDSDDFNNHNGSDPAEWNAASHSELPVDVLEPQAATEPSAYREASLRFLQLLTHIDNFMSDSVDPARCWRNWLALSLALGLRSTRGKSVTQVAGELSISKSLLSKTLRKFLFETGYSPAFGLKSEEAVATFRRIHLGKKRIKTSNGVVPVA